MEATTALRGGGGGESVDAMISLRGGGGGGMVEATISLRGAAATSWWRAWQRRKRRGQSVETQRVE